MVDQYTNIGRRAVLRGAAAVLAVPGGAALLGACSRSDGNPNAVTFLNVLPLTSLTFVPELFADAAGYFADAGLEVSFQSTRGTAQAIQLVLAGSAPVTRVGQIEVLRHIANSQAPIVNVGTVFKESTVRFVSSSSDPLREPRDFRGKLVGLPSEGGESGTTLDLLLASAGIAPEEVERQVVGVGPGVFNLVEQGRLAGFAVSIDTAMILERQIGGVNVLRPSEFIDSGAQVYIASTESLDANRDVLKRYFTSISRSLAFMIDEEGFEETIRVLREKYSFGTLQDTGVAQDSLREYVQVWTSDGRENVLRTVEESWRRGYDELVRNGQVAAGHDPSAWYTNELLPA
jgi:NitT/TauT family transport system substrate-binding protein